MAALKRLCFLTSSSTFLLIIEVNLSALRFDGKSSRLSFLTSGFFTKGGIHSCFYLATPLDSRSAQGLEPCQGVPTCYDLPFACLIRPLAVPRDSFTTKTHPYSLLLSGISSISSRSKLSCRPYFRQIER